MVCDDLVLSKCHIHFCGTAGKAARLMQLDGSGHPKPSLAQALQLGIQPKDISCR
jgi:hypothetical protein